MDMEKKMIEKRTANGDVYYVPEPEKDTTPEAAPKASHKRPEKGEKKEE